jgi:hypothetical protein
MFSEQLTRCTAPERIEDSNERALADLMTSHYAKIADILQDEKKSLTEAHWAMNWCETVDSKGEKVYVVAGLIPALDSKGKEITDMRATPTVFCIPEKCLTAEEEELFDKEKNETEDKSKREEIVQTVIRDRFIRKFYNMHGWGANPYVSALPMIEVASEFQGISILTGMMGSMGTTYQDRSPARFGDKSKYGWDEIRAQAIGAMYYMEGKEAFDYDPDIQFRRVMMGHSMQGKTVLRGMIDDLSKLPNTYFVSMTPVLAGGNKESMDLAQEIPYLKDTLRHVILGHNLAGLMMQIELKTVARLFSAETRRAILCTPAILYFVKKIMKSYLDGGDSYGQELIVYAHLLEYISNPWAIMRATENLENSAPTVGENSLVLVSQLVDRFMLVYAGNDKVLSPEQLIELAKQITTELNVSIEVSGGKLVFASDKKELKMPMYPGDNHYLKRASWLHPELGLIRELRSRLGLD